MPDGPATGAESPSRLRLDKQLCFPLYAASRLLTRLYQEQLAPLGITYPQYVVLMILWEDAPCSVKHIGQRAILNSNTLTPLLKRLEQQGLIERRRDTGDERSVTIKLTEPGRELEMNCSAIPETMLSSAGMSLEKLAQLKLLLDELLPLLAAELE